VAKKNYESHHSNASLPVKSILKTEIIYIPYLPVLFGNTLLELYCHLSGHSCLLSVQNIVIIIIIIIINCNWVITRWQWLFYVYTKYEIVY